MASDRSRANYPAQNAGHPARSGVPELWRNSILVGPQTAGIPTVHNEDEWARDSDSLPSNEDMVTPSHADESGGAIHYHQSQRRGGK